MVRRPSDGKPRAVNCRRRPIRTHTSNHPQPYRPIPSDKETLTPPFRDNTMGETRAPSPSKPCPQTLPDSVMAARQPLELKALVRTQAGQPDCLDIPSRSRSNLNLPPAITPRAEVMPEHLPHLDPARNKPAVTTDRTRYPEHHRPYIPFP